MIIVFGLKYPHFSWAEDLKNLEGDIQERSAFFTTSENGCLGSGVWQALPYTEVIEDSPPEETYYILRGEVVIKPMGDREIFLKAGDSYRIPKGD
ncbi:cupin domain-containing protein [Pseudomonas phoenicis]|uniref:cupin domain-containing protein n=1 Tax=unclassified Pseudomonas TaxID=196821 RepID=UPI0039A376A3